MLFVQIFTAGTITWWGQSLSDDSAGSCYYWRIETRTLCIYKQWKSMLHLWYALKVDEKWAEERWFHRMKDGRVIPSGGRYKMIQDGDSCYLQINNVSASDAGVYTCIVSNSQGKSSSSAALRLEGNFTCNMVESVRKFSLLWKTHLAFHSS